MPDDKNEPLLSIQDIYFGDEGGWCSASTAN